MLVETRPPRSCDAIAGLQDRPHARPCAAAHQTNMTAVLTCHQLEDDTRLTVTLDAEYDAFISPLHRDAIPSETPAPSRGNVQGRRSSLLAPSQTRTDALAAPEYRQ